MLINIKQDHNMILLKNIIKKQLNRELKHIDQFEANLKNAVLKKSNKQVLKLYTELKVGNSK